MFFEPPANVTGDTDVVTRWIDVAAEDVDESFLVIRHVTAVGQEACHVGLD